ncbi:MAG: hypothetical protein FD126_18, partial [Elusimicrobia bacterium]
MLAAAFALVRAPAFGQWSRPYDPDFPEETAAEAPAAQPGAPGDQTNPAGASSAGPFLLLDRPDASKPLGGAEPSTRPARDFSEFLLEQKGLKVDQDRWNRVREKAEAGTLGDTEFGPPPAPPILDLGTGYVIAGSSEPPKPPTPEVELPTYGTSLSITGRKTIGFSFAEKRFLNEQKTGGRPASSNLIDIEQQLQLRMQGKVGPKITVNVDYDDTKLNKQDISVVYQGDPNEVVQNASFGDIDLSLPATEFVSYNKQLFGIRVDLKYKRVKAIFIGSRTKGQTKAKQFKGNTQLITQDILDTNFIRRRYFDLSFGDARRLPLTPGSESVFLSRQVAGQTNVNEVSRTVDDLKYSTTTFTGNFVELSRGIDYTVDYVKGILQFRNTLDANAVVAVNFVDATARTIAIQSSPDASAPAAGSGRLKIVKTFGDVQMSTAVGLVGHQRELKTFYGLGRSQVLRDDGRGNFFLRVLDQNRNNVGAALNPRQTYPETIDVDFENGIFQLKQPFGTVIGTNTSTAPDPEIYAPSGLNKRLIQAEFRFRLRTFFLEPNLVLQSEAVLADGVRLTRNVDYFIDYESGFLTFFNDDRIKTDSTVDVTYEVAPFAGNATESLLGGRVAYELWKDKWNIGSTLLYQTGTKTPSVPSINELAKSLLVYEVDTQFTNIRLASCLTANFGAEMAESRSNPNLSKRALVENMEGVRQDDAASLQDSFWQPSQNPAAAAPGNTTDPAGLTITSFDEQSLVINPNIPAKPGETQKVLKVDYNFTNAQSTAVTFVYSFSPTGLDFSQKTVLEVVMAQDGQSDNELCIALGGFDEDADGDAGTNAQNLNLPDTEDVGKDGLPNTRDEGEGDNILQPNEDIGWLYNPGKPGGTQRRIGAGNGRVDSEDLNRNGRLDSQDFSGDAFGFCNPVAANAIRDVTDPASPLLVNGKMNFTTPQYHTLQVSLASFTADTSRWLAVKQVRITIRKPAGGGDNDNIFKIGRVAVVGSTWQKGQAGDPSTTGIKVAPTETLTVTPVNNVDNAEYKGRAIQLAGGDASEVFNDLYGSLDELKKQSNSSSISEQALQLSWNGLTKGTTVFTRRAFSRAIDISQHRKFNFLVFGNANDNTGCGAPPDLTGEKRLFLRAGSDRDFFEAQIPLNFCGWRKVSIEQMDRNGDQLPDIWVVAGGPSGTIALSSGNPNLQQIGTLVAGVYSSSATKTAGALYINEVYVDAPIVRVGNAEKLEANFTVPGWANFGGKYRFVDRNYQTPTTVVANQDNLMETGYLNITRLSWLPLNFTLAFSKVTTPNTNAVGDLSNVTSLLTQGTVRTWNGTANGTFQMAPWPRLTLNHERNRVEYDELSSRLDDRRSYKANASYSPPWRRFFVPRSVDGDYQYAKYSVSFESPRVLAVPGNFNTDEFTQGFGVRLGFEPWRGSNLSPSYSVSQIKEDRRDFSSGREILKSYPKSFMQTAGFTSMWNILPWFKPAVSYSASSIENNVLNVSTFIVGGSTTVFDIGDIKTVNRNATGNISLSLSAAEMFATTKLFRSFSVTNGYQTQDGDSWNNIERGLDTKTALWIRTPLRPSSRFAQRINLTLRDTANSTQRWSPVEAYDLKGRLEAFKSFSITNNFVKSVQRSETTGTPSKTISTTLPDLIASIGSLEKLVRADRWAKNMQMNFKYSQRTTENVATTLQTDDS